MGAQIKLCLEYAGVEYDEKRYTCGPPPTFDRSDWLNDKFNLGLDFPNLPYYIDGNVKLSQSLVIMRYIARKYNLVAKNDADLLRVETLEAQVRDYHVDFSRIVYNPQFKQLWPDYLNGLSAKFEALVKFLGERKFVVGDYVTYVDFLLFEFLEFHKFIEGNLVDKHPVLVEFHKRILALPAIDKYYKSDRFIKYPFNGAPALFGGPFSDQLNA